MDQDVDLLAQRVEKQRAKLDEEVTLLEMTEKRVTAAESDRQSAAREAERLKSRAKKAKRDARRLSSEAKRAQVRLEAIDSDHAQAVKEAKSRGKSVAKRQQKLAEAEGAHAAAEAETSSAARPASTRRRPPSSSTAAAKKTPPRKRAASSTTGKRTTKASPRRTTAKKASWWWRADATTGVRRRPARRDRAQAVAWGLAPGFAPPADPLPAGAEDLAPWRQAHAWHDFGASATCG